MILTLETILTFGKYKGKTCLEVISSDLRYANWLGKTFETDFAMAEQLGIRREMASNIFIRRSDIGLETGRREK